MKLSGTSVIFACVTLILLGVKAHAQTPDSCASITEFENGTVSDAAEVNCNFQLNRDLANKAFNSAIRNEGSIEVLSQSIDGLGLQNVIRVAKSGGDTDSLAVALQTAQSATAGSPVLISIAPGTYEQTEMLFVEDHVHIQGSGVGVTSLRCATGSNCGAILSIDQVNARVSDLSVYNNGVGVYGLYIQGADMGSPDCKAYIENVSVELIASGDIASTSIYATSCNRVEIKNSRAITRGSATYQYGAHFRENSFVRVWDLNTEARGTGNNRALWIYNNGNDEYRGVVAIATGGTFSTGAGATLGSPQFYNSYFQGSDASVAGYAIWGPTASFRIMNSELTADEAPSTYAMWGNSSSNHELSSSIAEGTFYCSDNPGNPQDCFRCGAVFSHGSLSAYGPYCN